MSQNDEGEEKFPELVLRVVVQFIRLNESGRDETTVGSQAQLCQAIMTEESCQSCCCSHGVRANWMGHCLIDGCRYLFGETPLNEHERPGINGTQESNCCALNNL